MKIIEYLKEHNNISNGELLHKLFVKYAIKSVQSKKYPELYLFKYTIKSPMNEIICQECRSIIINIDTLEIVSHPYHKFFNHGDELAHEIDWNTATCYEKLDGSIMIMYFYKGEWNVSTSGMPDGDGLINDISGKTFAETFWELWNILGYRLPNYFRSFTFMFEMVTKYNKIVCDYDKENISLHGMRNNKTTKEYIPNKTHFNWKIVKSHKLSNISDVIEFVNSRPAKKHEGIIVCDANFNRIKIKSEEYFNLHHIKSGLNCMKNIVELVRIHKAEETIKMFPEHEAEIRDIECKIDNLWEDINEIYYRIKDIKSQKEFASQACLHRFKSILFSMRKDDVDNCYKYLEVMRIKNLMKMIGVKSDEK